MKIIIAPDSFKGSLSALQVCHCIERGFQSIFANAHYVHLPLADGGEGTVEVLMQRLTGEIRHSLVSGPLGDIVDARWALLDSGKTALIEIAAASGLDLVSPQLRNPALTSTFGTGELIAQALDAGVTQILLGLGGSATNDGGAGIIEALGGKLLDPQGQTLPRGSLALRHLQSIDFSRLHPRCKEVELILACDVSNPLTGAEGASAVFGPQKGASPQLAVTLDESLDHFANIASHYQGINLRKTPGFGAAGGAPLGLSLIFNTRLKAGIEMILDCLRIDDLLQDADLLITGEGQIDNQTLLGKAPLGIAKRAKEHGIAVIAIAGSTGLTLDPLYPHIDAVFGSVRSPQPLSQVLEEAQQNITRTARNIAATLRLGGQLFSDA